MALPFRVQCRDASGGGFNPGDDIRFAIVVTPDAAIDGCLVAPTISGGAKTILGVQRDPVFGRIVMFGLGGIFVEALKDVTFRAAHIPPVRPRAWRDGASRRRYGQERSACSILFAAIRRDDAGNGRQGVTVTPVAELHVVDPGRSTVTGQPLAVMSPVPSRRPHSSDRAFAVHRWPRVPPA